MMHRYSGYFESGPLTGEHYLLIFLILLGLFLVARYVYRQYHKENRKLPPLEGENIKRRTTVEDLYPRKKDD